MKTKIILAVTALWLSACNLPTSAPTSPAAESPLAAPTPIETAPPPEPETLSPQPSPTPSAGLSPTASETPSSTLSPTASETATNEPSPTYAFPLAVVNQQAHCRYGPAKAYLHAADLYSGDSGTVRGRFQYSGWLLVKFDKLNYFCWVAPSVVTVTGNISLIRLSEVRLPGPSVLYSPPDGVVATRNENKVTLTWNPVNMTEDDDRGYFLELWVCQDGAYLWWTTALENDSLTSYTVRDEAGCPATSGGTLYAVEKHGYTRPVTIAWPAP